MCEILDPKDTKFDHDGLVFRQGEIEASTKLSSEDDVIMGELFYKAKGKLYCKHPDTDWHLMEVPKGKMLHCPAETELKIILPEPFYEDVLYGS